MKQSESLFVDIRGLRYHVRGWGRPDAPKLFAVHGWMDVSASFQFFVDALKQDWHVLAPDWRGYGLSQWSGADTYWFNDFIGDLDRLLAHFQPQGSVRLLGHSMGGSIASMYAGIRPERIARLINVDSLGMMPSQSDDAPTQYAKWLAWLRHKPSFQPYASFEALAERLRKQHSRLTVERSQWLARQWGREIGGREIGGPEIGGGSNGVELACDPRHRDVYSRHLAFRPAEMFACWRAVKAPVLMILADEGGLARQKKDLTPELVKQRLASYRNCKSVIFEETGHMVHLERPERLAEEVEAFLADSRS